jgi:hypothetical protein
VRTGRVYDGAWAAIGSWPNSCQSRRRPSLWGNFRLSVRSLVRDAFIPVRYHADPAMLRNDFRSSTPLPALRIRQLNEAAEDFHSACYLDRSCPRKELTFLPLAGRATSLVSPLQACSPALRAAASR